MNILFDALDQKKYTRNTLVYFYVNGIRHEEELGFMLWNIWGNPVWRQELRALARFPDNHDAILDRIHFLLIDYVTIHFLQHDDVNEVMQSLRELKFSIGSS